MRRAAPERAGRGVEAYNAGEGAVERYGNTIPPYEETRTYVARVLDYYNNSRGLN